MEKEQLHNLTNLIATVAQARPAVNANTIARNLSKLQRLAVSLHYCYAEAREGIGLEAKARALGEEISATVAPTKSATGNALLLNLDGAEYPLF